MRKAKINPKRWKEWTQKLNSFVGGTNFMIIVHSKQYGWVGCDEVDALASSSWHTDCGWCEATVLCWERVFGGPIHSDYIEIICFEIDWGIHAMDVDIHEMNGRKAERKVIGYTFFRFSCHEFLNDLPGWWWRQASSSCLRIRKVWYRNRTDDYLMLKRTVIMRFFAIPQHTTLFHIISVIILVRFVTDFG